MAMTTRERAARYRQNQKQQGGNERINMFANAETVKRLRLYSDYHEMTQSEALNLMIEKLWEEIPDEEKQAMSRHAEVLETKRKQRLAGDTSTLSLFD